MLIARFNTKPPKKIKKKTLVNKTLTLQIKNLRTFLLVLCTFGNLKFIYSDAKHIFKFYCFSHFKFK